MLIFIWETGILVILDLTGILVILDFSLGVCLGYIVLAKMPVLYTGLFKIKSTNIDSHSKSLVLKIGEWK